MYSKLITLVRVLQMYVTVYKCIESVSYSTYTVILELAHSALIFVCMHSNSHEVFQYTTTKPLTCSYLIFAQLLSQQTSNTVCACTILRPG